jgi:hypothetical protein
MPEPIKMTDAELTEVRKLQEQYQQKLAQFGLLYVDKMQVEEAVKGVVERENKLQEEWAALKKAENLLIDKFLKSYGEGSLDIQKGVFIPEIKPS